MSPPFLAAGSSPLRCKDGRRLSSQSFYSKSSRAFAFLSGHVAPALSLDQSYPKPQDHLGPEHTTCYRGFLAPCPLLPLPPQLGLPALCWSPSLRLCACVLANLGYPKYFQCKHSTTIKLHLPILSLVLLSFFPMFVHYKPYATMLYFFLKAVIYLSFKDHKRRKKYCFFIFTDISPLSVHFILSVVYEFLSGKIFLHLENLPSAFCENQACSSSV